MRSASGKTHPLGATLDGGGVNFALYSKSATAIELLLFDAVDDREPAHVIPLSPAVNRTFPYWHVWVEGLEAGQIYAFRVDGPDDPEAGHRFDREKILLDPYGTAVAVGEGYDRAAGARPGDNTPWAMKSVVAAPDRYDWEDDRRPGRPFGRTVIYEMHVRGFTRHPSSGVAPERRGTYLGVIDKIPYLQELGVTAVELLPVFQFDEQDAPEGLTNYWGYSPVSFFAPHAGYATTGEPLGVLDEFRDMVKALHRAGIEVFLDVVYNHTAEGDHRGPTLSFKGLENATYYMLKEDARRYQDFTGTGNTLNGNHSVVRRIILDSLKYWVCEMHVDGFRFDLASVLAREETGEPLANPPVLWSIDTDPVLAGTKLIAEAWDLDLYQVGTFIGDRWKEWNGRFRDDVRAFVRGDRDTTKRLSVRLLASPDLYLHEEREAGQSINFVTCHDGFTLNDVVSYDRKHNEANREDNRDGTDHNLSWNCGVEGPTDDPEIEALRDRQAKNLLVATLLSLGTPMLSMGDEVRRTQLGNNNAYCQDNEISWLDWRLLERHRDFHRFVGELIALRLQLDVPNGGDLHLSLGQLLERLRFEWHGVELDRPDWTDDSHSLAFDVNSLSGTRRYYVAFNAYREALEFELPAAQSAGWRRVIDTALASPEDIRLPPSSPAVTDGTYRVGARSCIVLLEEL